MFLILTVYPGTYKYSSVYTESPSIYIIDSVNLFRKTGFFFFLVLISQHWDLVRKAINQDCMVIKGGFVTSKLNVHQQNQHTLISIFLQ